MTEVPFEEWKKLDLRIVEILSVEDHPNADKLYVLKVDLGTEKRTVVAGIKNYYPKEKLIGKKVVVFTNLQPAVLRGIKSEGMILAADDRDADAIALLQPEKDIKNGAIIR